MALPFSTTCALLAGLLTTAGAIAASTNSADHPLQREGTVREIRVVTKRVSPSVVSNELAFKEGDAFTAESIEESRHNLHRLGLFRSLEITPEWDDTLNGYRVTVNADDGWFFIPWPMFGSRGGDSFGAILLMEQNYFRKSEGIMMFGSWSEEQFFSMGGFFLPRASLMGGFGESDGTQYVYTDGGRNAKPFDDDSDWGDDPGDFGTITNSYGQRIKSCYFHCGWKSSSRIRLNGGCSFSNVRYEQQDLPPPDDSGNVHSWTLGLSYGKERSFDPSGHGGFFGSMGRVFGLGMAGVKDSLKPLPRSETSRRINFSAERGEEWLGSDFEFSRLLCGVSQSTTFRNRSALALSAQGEWGDDLPESQLLGTSRRGLLSGVYAREYRGDRLAGGTVSLSRPFFRNIVGQLNTEIFADYASCHNGDGWDDKQGVGFNMAYRFWRFPFPVGNGVTYCLDDDNWQISFAFGGMF